MKSWDSVIHVTELFRNVLLMISQNGFPLLMMSQNLLTLIVSQNDDVTKSAFTHCVTK